MKGRSYRETRSAVLDLIRSGNGVSRVELARQSGLTEGTISKIARDLLTDGVIEKAGEAKSTGGKRATLLRLSSTARYALGVTLDTSSVVIVLCGLDGSLRAESRAAGIGAEDPPRALARVAEEVEGLLARTGVGKEAVVGVGLASAGRLGGALGWGEDAARGDEWERFDAGPALTDRLDLPVTVENDANCAALGVFWSSGQRSSGTFMTVYMSHGIGAGIVIGGSLYHGASGNAGEIGHIIVEPDGRPCWCGSSGCLETVATPRATIDRVLADPRLRQVFGIGPQPDRASTYRRVLDAAHGGSPEAIALLETSARRVAEVVLGLVNTLDLDSIQLAGPGFGSAGEVYLRALRSALAERSLARGVHPIDVRFAGGGPEVAALGAASVVLHRNLTPHHAASARS